MKYQSIASKTCIKINITKQQLWYTVVKPLCGCVCVCFYVSYVRIYMNIRNIKTHTQEHRRSYRNGCEIFA